MLLRIQPDESLRSYVDRNLLVNFMDWRVDRLRWLAEGEITHQAVKVIASTMGWEGCYGFNRLLHEHTQLPLQFVIRDTRDVSYSRTAYLKPRTAITNSDSHAYCPECVRQDVKDLGFSYWRRNFPDHVSVCATHNVVLLSTCPYCDQPFSSKGHNLDVMWRKCSGRHLGDAESVMNLDEDALKHARFVEALCAYEFSISIHSAVAILSDKLRSLKKLTKRMKSERKAMIDFLDRISINLEEKGFDSPVINSEFLPEEILKIVVYAYETFDRFVVDLYEHDKDLIPIESLWRNYGNGRYATTCRE
ncbi:TniQ family protein [Pseudomonas putida]|uniref:TniQ family protein n=1 Tax=Pseudomonas putida TaxID=303 RepID=UPI002270E5A0|nr:TniQ family protein [Pseudomonas putida]WAB98061.1 TniQ family protein [Pseudomonas putida]